MGKVVAVVREAREVLQHFELGFDFGKDSQQWVAFALLFFDEVYPKPKVSEPQLLVFFSQAFFVALIQNFRQQRLKSLTLSSESNPHNLHSRERNSLQHNDDMHQPALHSC